MNETPEGLGEPMVPGTPTGPEPTWPTQVPNHTPPWGASGAAQSTPQGMPQGAAQSAFPGAAPGPGPNAGPTQYSDPNQYPGSGPYQYQYPYQSPLPPPSAKRRRSVPTAIAGALVLVAAAAGVGIGHTVWHSPVSAGVSAQSGTLPSGLPNGSAGGNGGFGGFSGNGGESGGSSGGSGSSGSGTSEGSGGPTNVSEIASTVDPALVDVNTTFGYQSAEGAGTGIVLTSTGEILTNNHVIDGATSVSVTDIGNGKTYTATVVGYDDAQDVAVLQLQGASGLTTAKLGNSAQAAVNEAVVAIGNAGGTGGTPSSAGGSITALNQSITAGDELDGASEQLSGLIEVNADVQSGDSGGSLVNSSGQVIGIDTAASTGFSIESSGGQGYAIPIDEALTIAGDITSGKSSTDVHVGGTAFLGILVSPSSTGQAGADVSGVLSSGAAESAGLVNGDVITSLNNQTVGSSSELTTVVSALKPGAKVELGWVDTSGQSHTTTVELGSGPPA
jgi:S1-C subfamily serine protease